MIPDTQREAYEAIKPQLGYRQQRVLETIDRPQAGFEVAQRLGWETYRTLPRITELFKKGLLADTGRRTINPSSGCKVIIWDKAA